MKASSLQSFQMYLIFLLTFALFSLYVQAYYVYGAVYNNQWTIFKSVNILANPGFEEGPLDRAYNWDDYTSGYEIDPNGGRNGGRALKIANTDMGEYGSKQEIILNQIKPCLIYFSGWSKAEGVTGNPDINYSIYLDLKYNDGSFLYTQVVQFDIGTHDWQFLRKFISPDKPVERIFVYCLLRDKCYTTPCTDTHNGIVWFDDLCVREIKPGQTFDSVQIITNPPLSLPYGGNLLSITTNDGLVFTMSSEGGALLEVKLYETPVEDTNSIYESGFFIRDLEKDSNFIHVGGDLMQDGNRITHISNITELDMNFSATYDNRDDHIAIHAELNDINNTERALTLYFALPINANEEWLWWDDIRTSRSIKGSEEFVNSVKTDLGSTGYVSKYPWACLSGPYGGVAIALPLENPCVMRIIYNPVTKQFYAAFDLGLSPQAKKFPNKAWVDLIIYQFDSEWGFRAAVEGYYKHFNNAFKRRFPAEMEGIWVAFSDLSHIDNISDFGIAFHEIGDLNLIPFDQNNNITPFFYFSEPQTHWLPINDCNIDLDDHNQVINYIKSKYAVPNLLKYSSFEESFQNFNEIWADYGSGYTIDPNGGRNCGRALKLTNTDSGHYGANQVIYVNQDVTHPIYFSGWSKAENVTSNPSSDYSIYLDIYYMDGSYDWGKTLKFNGGIYDWQFLEDIFIPDKPIERIHFHCLLRGTSRGIALFDDLHVYEVFLKNRGFEEIPSSIEWNLSGSGCMVDETVSRSGIYSLKLENSSPSEVQVASQVINMNQTEPKSFHFSAWSKAEDVTGVKDKNYGTYLEILYNDGNSLYSQFLDFDTGTHEWQFREGIFIPEKPVNSIYINCLLGNNHNGTVWFDDISLHTIGYEGLKSSATISSGLFDEYGHYGYISNYNPPWCAGSYGCTCFTLNPDPDISDPDHPLNKAYLDWNHYVKNEIIPKMGPYGGAYMDSFLRDFNVMNFRSSHFAAADIPLSFYKTNLKVGIPEVFSTVESARWVAEEVHNDLNLNMMANWILRDLPWGADLFDVMGTETNWLDSNNFSPDSDATLSYCRTLSFQRPYCLLMNTDFNRLTHELVERYFEICLFYGIYPSMFSLNAADNPYWEDPNKIYNRDRVLFKRYIPLMRTLNKAGWQPVTYAISSDPNVYIERFGNTPSDLHFTLRNMKDCEVSVDITFQADALGLPFCHLQANAELSNTTYDLNPHGSNRSISVNLLPYATEILTIVLTSDMNIPAGWSMISLPLIPENSYISSLFPDAVVVYDYVKGKGYVKVEELEVGQGYWILLDHNQNYTLTGKCIDFYNQTVDKDGWEMIGGCTYPAQAAADSCKISVIYKFVQGTGYKRLLESEFLEPGKGYWILFEDVENQCMVTVDYISPGP